MQKYYGLVIKNSQYTIYNSYLPVIGVHEMHGRMHPNYWQITILLVFDLYSSLAYFMMTQPLPIAGKLPIKTLVAKQLPTNMYIKLICIAGMLVRSMQISTCIYMYLLNQEPRYLNTCTCISACYPHAFLKF